VNGGAQILGSTQHGFGQFDDLVPVRLLGGLDRVAYGALGLRRGSAFEREKFRVVFEIRPCRRFVGYRGQLRTPDYIAPWPCTDVRENPCIITNYRHKATCAVVPAGAVIGRADLPFSSSATAI